MGVVFEDLFWSLKSFRTDIMLKWIDKNSFYNISSDVLTVKWLNVSFFILFEFCKISWRNRNSFVHWYFTHQDAFTTYVYTVRFLIHDWGCVTRIDFCIWHTVYHAERWNNFKRMKDSAGNCLIRRDSIEIVPPRCVIFMKEALLCNSWFAMVP